VKHSHLINFVQYYVWITLKIQKRKEKKGQTQLEC
jgi:hypothetical protein